MSITDRIAKLERELAALKAECKCEMDWEKVPRGTFVEVRDRDENEWEIAKFVGLNKTLALSGGLYFANHHMTDSLLGTVSDYKQCRLAPHVPSIMNWVAFDGTRPNLPDGTLIALWQEGIGIMPCGEIRIYTWPITGKNLMYYAVIEGPK